MKCPFVTSVHKEEILVQTGVWEDKLVKAF